MCLFTLASISAVGNNKLVHQGLVQVLNRRNQEVLDAVDGRLDEVEVHSERHHSLLHHELGLSLGKLASDYTFLTFSRR